MSPVRKPSTSGLRTAAVQAARDVLRETGIGHGVADLEAGKPQRPRAEKPVRFTLDLDRDHHQFLKSYAAGIEAKGAAEVMRALLDELRDDPELAARVRVRVWGP